MPPEDTSGSVPPAEEPVLGVTRVSEVGAAAGSSELKRRDSELHAASKGLEVANQQAENTKTELDRVRSVFQSEKDSQRRELQQALANKEEIEK